MTEYWKLSYHKNLYYYYDSLLSLNFATILLLAMIVQLQWIHLIHFSCNPKKNLKQFQFISINERMFLVSTKFLSVVRVRYNCYSYSVLYDKGGENFVSPMLCNEN
uniref:Uncharacterized protein n=1 Tax=Glossina austeni TaxID=7395 RepID=A0A1A9VTI3_GLOAU